MEELKCFSSLEDKGNLRFLKFDVKQFYPSIIKPLMLKGTMFARLHTSISREEEMILFHASSWCSSRSPSLAFTGTMVSWW